MLGEIIRRGLGEIIQHSLTGLCKNGSADVKSKSMLLINDLEI